MAMKLEDVGGPEIFQSGVETDTGEPGFKSAEPLCILRMPNGGKYLLMKIADLPNAMDICAGPIPIPDLGTPAYPVLTSWVFAPSASQSSSGSIGNAGSSSQTDGASHTTIGGGKTNSIASNQSQAASFNRTQSSGSQQTTPGGAFPVYTIVPGTEAAAASRYATEVTAWNERVQFIWAAVLPVLTSLGYTVSAQPPKPVQKPA